MNAACTTVTSEIDLKDKSHSKTLQKVSEAIHNVKTTHQVLPENCQPVALGYEKFISNQILPVLDSLISIAKTRHPELVLYDFKLNSLTLESEDYSVHELEALCLDAIMKVAEENSPIIVCFQDIEGLVRFSVFSFLIYDSF